MTDYGKSQERVKHSVSGSRLSDGAGQAKTEEEEKKRKSRSSEKPDMSCNISEDRPGSMKNIVIEGSSEL